MVSLKLDEETCTELVTENGRWVEIEGLEEVAQRLRIRLRTLAGEWPYNTALGVPDLDEFFGKGRDPAALVAIYRRHILGTRGITEIPEGGGPFLELDDDRQLTITFRARAGTLGIIDFSEPILEVS